MANSSHDDPFADLPDSSNAGSPIVSRFGAQFRGVFSAMQPHVEQVTDQALDWAASNPDKLEAIGERVGQAAAVGTGGGMFARRAGKKMGGKLGRMASKKAQGVSSQQSSPSPIKYDPSDPFL